MDFVFVFLDELEDFHDGGIAFPPGHIGTVILFSIFQVHAEDAFVILLDKGNGGLAGSGYIVSDIQIDAQVFPVRQHFPVVGGGCNLGVIVKCDDDFVFICERSESSCGVSGEFASDAFCPERLGRFEIGFDLFVRHGAVANVAEFDDMNVDPCIVIHLAQCFVAVQGITAFVGGGIFSCVLCGGSAHQLDGTEAVLNQVPQEILGAAGHGAVTVCNRANLDAVEVGVGFLVMGCEQLIRHQNRSRGCRRAA